jgi:predicted acetyltransferase
MKTPVTKLQVSKVGPESEQLIRNLFEHYIHDMSEWLQMDTEPDGSYSYDASKLWAQGFDVHLAKSGDSIAGFAITGSADEWLGDIGAHDVHEFFVLRKFRRSGMGRQLAQYIWNLHPGEWVVRVFEDNRPAIPFWRTAIAAYTNGSYQEEQRIIKGRAWRFFRFEGARPSEDSSVVRSAQ